MPESVRNCGHESDNGWMYLHSRCHMGDPAYVRVKGNTLVVECAKCDQTIATFVLHEDRPSLPPGWPEAYQFWQKHRYDPPGETE